MPFFSIIIPVYNVALYLRECLDSVLAQTFTDWEAICVDDGSTDGSGAILDEYAAKDKRFRVIHQPNSGVSVARNKALEVSMGSYILFMDADDIYLSDDTFLRLEKELKNSNERELLFFGYRTFSKEGQVESVDVNSVPIKIDIAREVPLQALKLLFGEICYRRNLVEGMHFPENKIIGEDMAFIGEILCKIDSLRGIGETFYGYRTRQGSASHSKSTLRKFCEIIDLNEYWLERFATVGKRLSLAAYDYIAKWLFEWNPQRLKWLTIDEKRIAEERLITLYRKFGRAGGNRLRYRLATAIGDAFGSWRLTRILSGKMPWPHFGLMVTLKKILHLQKV